MIASKSSDIIYVKDKNNSLLARHLALRQSRKMPGEVSKENIAQPERTETLCLRTTQ
jgi:hypothetical protein